MRLVRRAKIFSGAGERAGGLCCGGGRVGARAIVFDKQVFVKRSFERAWVSRSPLWHVAAERLRAR